MTPHQDDLDLLKELLACEIKVWEALVAGDTEEDAAALDDSFLGLYSDGYSDKAAHVAQLDNGPTVKKFTLSQHRVLILGKDHAMLCYHAKFQRCGHQNCESMWVSSVWQRANAGWINIFSQDTPVSDWKPV